MRSEPSASSAWAQPKTGGRTDGARRTPMQGPLGRALSYSQKRTSEITSAGRKTSHFEPRTTGQKCASKSLDYYTTPRHLLDMLDMLYSFPCESTVSGVPAQCRDLCALLLAGRLRIAVYEHCPPPTKKAEVVEHPQVFDHVGLLASEPPGTAGLLFI